VRLAVRCGTEVEPRKPKSFTTEGTEFTERSEEKRSERPAIWETIAATGIFNLAFEAEERGEKITRRRGGTRRNGSRYGIDRAVRRGKTPAGCPSFLRASRRYRRSGAG
jgi:hypothetical protein